MRFRHIEAGGERGVAVDFHRQVTVIQGLTGEARQQFIDALAGIVSGHIDGTTGVIEAQDIEFGIDADTVALLELQSSVDIVLRPDQLPQRNEEVHEVSARLDRAIALRHDMSGQLDERRVAYRALVAERDVLAGEGDGERPIAGLPPDDQLGGDRLVGDRARAALALADRWEQLEARLTVSPLQARQSGHHRSPAEAHDVALAAARLTVDQARRALHEAELSNGTTNPSAPDVEALERAHEELIGLQERTSARFPSGRARRRMERRMAEAQAHERGVLDRLGLVSYAEFAMSSSSPTSVSDDGALEASAAALAEAEEALAACEAEEIPDDIPPEQDAAPRQTRDDLVAQLADLRREVEGVLGREPGPFPAAELRAATSLSPRPAVMDIAEGTGSGDGTRALGETDEAFEVDSSELFVQERVLRRREVEDAMTASAAGIWMLELEAAAVDDRVVDLEKTLHAAEAAPPLTEEEQLEAWEAIEWYVLARMSAQRRISVAGSVPFVLDDPFADLRQEDKLRLVERVSRMAETVQVVIVSDDSDIGAWATSVGSHQAAVISLATSTSQ